MKLVTNDKKYLKYVMILNFRDGFPFSKHLFAVEMGKTEIKMNKPEYLGQANLDLSKTLMYEFHYDYVRLKYGSQARLCYMETKNFVYEIEAKYFHRKYNNMPLPIGENKKEIGLMKDELGRKIMTEFLALRAKMYAYKKIGYMVPQHEHFVTCDEKHCKSTKKCLVTEGLKFDDFRACLYDGETIYREQMLFENKKYEVYTINKHELYPVNKHKIALDRGDDKRLVQDDGITTLARGYVSLSA